VVRTQDGRRRLLTALLSLVIGVGGLLATSCVLSPSSGKDPIPPDGDIDRKTIENLITKWLPDAYSTMDSTAYADALDEAYIFELLEDEVDPGIPSSGWWERSEELAIAGSMFTGRYNPEGIKVDGIDLKLQLKTNPTVDNTVYPDRPDGEIWYKATAYVDLTVITTNPTASDGSGIVNYIVNSDQIFVCRPDPDADSLWVIRKQTDQKPIN